MITLLNRYIFKEFISLVAVVLIGILSVYLCIEFLQKADKLLKHHATISQVIRYFLYSTPIMITMSLPLATLIAALLSLGNLSRHSEIIAMRAGGVSLTKIIIPLLMGGALMSALGFINNEFIMPACTSRANHIRSVEIEKNQVQVMFQQAKLWLRGPDNSIANIELVSPDRNEMLGLNVYKLNPDYSVRERIIAGSLVWKNGAWRLKDSRTTAILGNTIRSRVSDGEVFNIVAGPDDLGTVVKDPQEMSFGEMWEYVHRLRTSGYPSAKYEVNLHKKIAFPLASLLVVLIAVPFSFHKVRGGGMSKGFALAILIASAYLLVMSVGQSLGNSGALPPVIAAWLANIIFAVATAAVLIRMQKTV